MKKFSRMFQYLKKYPLSLVLVALILYLSFFTPPKTELSKITNFDKVVHLLMYFGFCCILWFEYLRAHLHLNRMRLFWGAIIAPILFSGAIELLQKYAQRSGEWWDFAMNVGGVLLAVLFSWYITRPLLLKLKKRSSKG